MSRTGRISLSQLDELRPDRLMERARRTTSLDDFGETPFQDALDVLCRAAREDRPRLDQGISRLSSNLERQLGLRLQLAADRKKHPEISRQEIKAPLILIGLPRSGTTILHSLLAQDPAARSPQRWEMTHPFPPPRAETYETDPL